MHCDLFDIESSSLDISFLNKNLLKRIITWPNTPINLLVILYAISHNILVKLGLNFSNILTD